VLVTDALRTNPAEPDLHHLLGVARSRQGRIQEAIAHLEEAIRLNPAAVGSLSVLASLLVDQERLGEALEAYRAALNKQPSYLPALIGLSLLLCRAGMVDRALPFLEAALQLDPNSPDAHHYLAYAQMTLGRLSEAEQHIERALTLKPGTGGYLSTFGLLREKQRRPIEATALFQQAVHNEPQLAEPWSNLGMNHAAYWGNYPAARECFERALALRPQFADARYHLGMIKLTTGDLAGGWSDYESRPTLRQKPLDRYHRPRWQGEDLTGRTILLHAEQGLGDTLHFIRYARELKARGASVLAEVQRPLIPLLSRTPGVDAFIPDGETLPPHDVQIPLLSIPAVIGMPTDASPYLFADPERTALWRERLAAIPGFKIGIGWQGDANFKYDWLRSVPLAEFQPLADVPGVTLISLQKNLGVEQLAANKERVPVRLLEPEIDASGGAFLDTAAIMPLLDLVITSDTALVHLAGGLGASAWLALMYAPDWRWQHTGETTPWYPTVRIFRQERPAEWPAVFQRMAAELRQRVGAPGHA
jgi:tetratricopeptide (TPR) repeat protein